MHLDKSTTEEWLKEEGFSGKEIDIIWEYFGGSIPRVQKLLREKENTENLRNYLEEKAFLAYTEIVDLLTNEKDKGKRELFEYIAKEIVEKGKFLLKKNTGTEIKDTIRKYCESEILFFDPMSLEITGNSRIYEKGMEILVFGI
jgi:hypothetical protein